MRIVLFSSFDELTPYAEEWDRLNDASALEAVPFRSWDWSSAWWQYYGELSDSSRKLFILGVFDGFGKLIGLAPWYLDRSMAFGRVVRFLGAGEVCADYLDVISRTGREEEVCDALAEWLAVEVGNYADLVELTAVDSAGSNIEKLAKGLGAAAYTTHQRGGDSCWRIELPVAIGQYLSQLSKNRRKVFRRTQRRMIDSGRAILRTAENVGEAAEFMEILIDLHKRRFFVDGRQTSNCSERFWNFHRDVAQRLFASGRAQLHLVEIDGSPAAAEYQLSGGGRLYAYQSGIDPDRLDDSPGVVAMVSILQWAVGKGYLSLDLLRGDESYKAHWLAKPRKCEEFRIVPEGLTPQIRHAAWLAGTTTYQWLKNSVKQNLT